MSTPPDQNRLPNLIIAGVSKAGTTSLFNYLARHPDVGTSDVKEVRYFTPLRSGKPLEPLATYTAHFPNCSDRKVVLEATPGYFYGGRAIASAIRASCPGVRVLVSLRTPEERCWSWFGFVKSRLRIPKEITFEQYLDRCEELHRAGVDGEVEHQPYWGLGGGCYAQWFDSWVHEFGDRYRVLFFDDLVSDPASLVTSVCGWLGLETAPLEAFDYAVENKTEQYRHRGLQRAAVTLNRRLEQALRRHPTVKRRLRRGYYLLNRAPTESGMPPDQWERLRAFYRPYNEQLAEQLAAVGLRLPPSW